VLVDERNRVGQQPQTCKLNEAQKEVPMVAGHLLANGKQGFLVSELRAEALIRPRGRPPVPSFAGCPVLPPPPPAGLPPI
jgi:hypothetical protein